MKARGDIPIILCCSEDDEPALAKVVDELLREGMAPELVPGVEFDPNLMSAAVDNAGVDALFVLCISPALDKGAARRLTGLFSARSGQGQRIISTAFTPSRPLAILPAIRGALREMRLTEAQQSLDEEPIERGSNLRDVVEAFADPLPSTPVQIPVATVDAEALARELAMGMAEAEAILQRREQEHARSDVRRARTRGTPATPVPRTSAPPSAAAAPRAHVEPIGGTIESRLESALPHVEALVTDGEPSRKIPRSMIPAPGRALADEPQGNRWLLAFAGIGIAGIVVLALLQLFRPGPPEAAPRAGARGAAVPASTTEPSSTRKDGDREAPTTAAVPEPPVADGDTKVPSDAKAAVAADAKSPDTTTPDAKTPDAKTPAEPTNLPPPPKGAVSKRDVQEAALTLAVQEGRLVKVGKLFVQRALPEELTWTEANTRCQGRRVNGIGGFRLPVVSELKRLRAAMLLGSGSWWSRKKAADDEAVALDAASGATNVYLTIEPAGRAICVRTL